MTATAIAYIRTSTSGQDSSPAAQRLQIEAWASSTDVTILEWCSDVGVSSVSSIDQRPGLVEALAAVARLRPGFLVAAALDRFARDPSIVDSIRTLVRASSAALATSDGIADVGDDDDVDPTTWMVYRIRALFAAYELRMIRWRTRQAVAGRRKAGKRTGQVPFGKMMRPDGQHSAKCSHQGCNGCLHLCDHPQEIQAREYASSLRADGVSLAKIGLMLKARGYSPRGESWHRQSVAALLASGETEDTTP